jgi:hypothetical protein
MTATVTHNDRAPLTWELDVWLFTRRADGRVKRLLLHTAPPSTDGGTTKEGWSFDG